MNGALERRWVVRESAVTSGRYFHFFDRRNYGEPQFGDMYAAKRYSTLAACTQRLRALRAEGYSVIPVLVETPAKATEGPAP